MKSFNFELEQTANVRLTTLRKNLRANTIMLVPKPKNLIKTIFMTLIDPLLPYIVLKVKMKQLFRKKILIARSPVSSLAGGTLCVLIRIEEQ